MQFFCDNDVDAAVAERLRLLGHDAWTAAQAGLAAAEDDDLTVYADDRGAVLVTHDREFSRRRRKNVVGRHVFLRCNEWEAADLLEKHLEQVLRVLSVYEDLWVAVSKEGVLLSFDWR